MRTRTSTNTTIFLHVPKTAGTSLRHVISQVYPGKRAVFVYSHELLGARRHRTTLRQRVEEADVVYGHLSYGAHRALGVDGKYVAFVRDPVDRVASFFRHHAREPEMELHRSIGQGMTLVDLLRSGECHQVSNHMTRILSGRHDIKPKKASATLALACENLESHFRAVGVAEHMEASIGRIAELLQWPVRPVVPHLNVDPERGRFALNDETRAEIVRCNSLDIELYNRVLQRTCGTTPLAGTEPLARALSLEAAST